MLGKREIELEEEYYLKVRPVCLCLSLCVCVYVCVSQCVCVRVQCKSTGVILVMWVCRSDYLLVGIPRLCLSVESSRDSEVSQYSANRLHTHQ